MKYPAELYVRSSRPYKGLSDLEYPIHERTVTVSNCARVCIGRRKISATSYWSLSNALTKQMAENHGLNGHDRMQYAIVLECNSWNTTKPIAFALGGACHCQSKRAENRRG